MSLILFTDLDGTLMEHDTYSVEPARAALQALAELNIQPIINSSKTGAEIEQVQKVLKLSAPYVCENGAALCNYQESTQVFASPRDSWLESVHQIRAQLGLQFEGFEDWNYGQISELTGLSENYAQLAKQRQFSEPIIWRDTKTAKQQFESALQTLGLQLLEGGRFFSIQSDYDKSTAMHWLRRQMADKNSITIALGDSPNDIAMLEAADVAVIIKSAKSEQIVLASPKRIIHSNRPGPAGWQIAITEILQLYQAGELTVDKERGVLNG